MEAAVLTSARTNWILDIAHSELSFKVKHLMISNVKGEFKKLSAEIGGSDFATSPVSVTIEASSVNTNDEQRDAHLRGAEFFDTDNFKEIKFKSSSFKRIGDDNYKLAGILTMKGVSKEIILDVEFGGTNSDPWGNEKAAFSINGKLKRSDWGLSWNSALETGGVLVSDEVKISADVQFVKKSVE